MPAILVRSHANYTLEPNHFDELNHGTAVAGVIKAVMQKPGGPFFLRPTGAGMQYMPSLPARPPTFRPIVPEEVTGDWELAAVFAENTTGTQAEPCVLHNTKTDGYLAIINQSADFMWVDRASAVSEFLNLWMVEQAVGYTTPTAVEPRGKLAVAWASLKA